MDLPDTNRVIYSKNPLNSVICQLKFPSILKIGSSDPIDFQEEIRNEFPIYEKNLEYSVESNLPIEVIAQLPQDTANAIPYKTVTRINYKFTSADKNWVINLANDFLALSVKRYDRWDNFREHFLTPLTALWKIYKPTFFSRIGLRYVNAIDRSVLGLSASSWKELIEPFILGMLSSTDIENDSLKNSMSIDEVRLTSEISARVLHGLGRINNSKEIIYLIDNDIFSEKQIKDSKDAVETLNALNSYGRKLFRWCITDKLHDAMEPSNPL